MGLREEKKIKTRAAISLLATQLFMERGFDNVTTAEIAELAGVSVPTLFKYFSTKEALVFDEDAEREKFLVDTVKNRPRGQSILDALLKAGLKEFDAIPKAHLQGAKSFARLVDKTPQLALYAQQMWLRHEKSLAAAIKLESKKKLSAIEAEAVARFVLDAYHRAMSDANPKASLKMLFRIIEKGFSA